MYTVNTNSIKRAEESATIYREQNPFKVDYTLTDAEENTYNCRRLFPTKQEAETFAKSVNGKLTILKKES